jgi:hypothetical protein
MTNIELIDQLFNENKVIVDNDNLTLNIKIDYKLKILLNDLQDKLVLESYSINGIDKYSLDDIKIDDKVDIVLSKSYLSTEYNYDYFTTFDDFLTVNRTKLSSIDFCIVDKKYSSISSEGKITELLYHNSIINLFYILDKISVNREKDINSDYEYIIFDKRRITIKTFYCEKELLNLFKNLEIEIFINELYQEVIGDLDRRINGIFLINAIEDVFQKKKKIDFNDFFNSFLEIYHEYQVHHRAYVNTLDLGKMKIEAEKILKDDFSKVNSLVSDINSKIIFLPIAFIGVLTQISSDNSLSKNIFIVLCMYVFTLITIKFTSMLSEILNVIKDEIDEKEEEYIKIEKLYKELESKINRVKNLIISLKERFSWTINLSWILFIFVFTLVVAYELKVFK